MLGTPILKLDPPKQRMTALERASHYLNAQRKWIEHCESGRSYTGPNGKAIREADYAELKKWEEAYAKLNKNK